MKIRSSQIVNSHLGSLPWIHATDSDSPAPGSMSSIASESLAMGACLYFIENSGRAISELEFETENKGSWREATLDLQMLFHFLTKRTITVSFVDSTMKTSAGPTENPKAERRDAVLFSGGSDSLCGVFHLSKEGRKLVLVHSMTSPRMESKAKRIHREYLRNANSCLYYVESRFRGGSVSPSYPQLRSTMFLMNAFPFLEAFKSSSIFIPENGPLMINPPISGLTISTQATRPEVLFFVQRILKTVSSRSVRIDSPFKDKTKAEILAMTPNRDAIKATYSCFNYRWGKYQQMCGHCFGCNITRLSMFANGIKDERFEHNPFESNELPTDYKRQKELFMYSDLIRNSIRFAEKKEIDDEISLSIRQAEEFYSRDRRIDVVDLMKRFGLDMLLGMRNMYNLLSIEPRDTILGRRLMDTVPGDIWSAVERRSEELHSLKKAT